MMALSILFSGRGQNWPVVLLPSTIALSAAASTIVVWGKSRYPLQDGQPPRQELEQLQQRIETLEAITTRDAQPWSYPLNQLNVTPSDREHELG
jgi:hypothetical protein